MELNKLLNHLSEEEIMDLPLSMFSMDLKKSWISPYIKKLKIEISTKEINFIPHIWISTEWFSPDGVA